MYYEWLTLKVILSLYESFLGTIRSFKNTSLIVYHKFQLHLTDTDTYYYTVEFKFLVVEQPRKNDRNVLAHDSIRV